MRRVALPADLVRRIKNGEQVSAEEITAAQERVLARQSEPKEPENEWLPPNATTKASSTRNRRRRK